MKTDYGRLGQESLQRALDSTVRADKLQEELLLSLVRKNRFTEFGRIHDFAGIRDINTYQKKVPVSVFEDYEPYIARIIDGEENLLTAGRAVYFCISSGTVGDEKYIPLTEDDLNIHYHYMYGIIFGQMRAYYKHLDAQEVFGRIFQIGEFAKTCMSDGRMNGIRTTCIYQWLDRDGTFDASDYCVPKEVLFPAQLEDLLYVKVRFALSDRKLRAIHGVFVNRIVSVMEYILQNWEQLVQDMEQGTVSPDVALSDRWRQFVLKKLPADKVRAAELRAICKDGMEEAMVSKIWPEVRYILAVGGERFPYYTEKMRLYAKGIPIHHYAYAASEGIFGFAWKVDVPDAYVLLADSVFFEFISEDGGQDRPLLMGEVKQGGRYELIVTTQSGLYRYRLGDVVEVVGFCGRAPVVRLCYRINQVMNIAGEKSNQQQFDKAVEWFCSQTGASVLGYCVDEDVSHRLPGYRFYMEADRLLPDSDAMYDNIFEACLCRANPAYRACRKMREIGPLHIVFLRRDTFGQYEKEFAAKGKSMAQSKMPHFVDSEEKRLFFEGRVIGI